MDLKLIETTPDTSKGAVDELAAVHDDAASYPSPSMAPRRHLLTSATLRALLAERDEWRRRALDAGVCPACALGAPESFGCWDCRNTGRIADPAGDVVAAARAWLAAADAYNRGGGDEVAYVRLEDDYVNAKGALRAALDALTMGGAL